MPGYRHCITEESADRQRQFEVALLELMSQRGFAQISVQDICARVGLSRKSFYRYFSSKEDCLAALVDHTILGLADVPVRGEHVQRMLEQYFAYWSRHKKLLEALYSNGFGDLLMERSLLCAVQEFGVRTNPQENSAGYTQTIFLVSGLVGVLEDWHRTGYRMSPVQLAAALGSFLPQYPQGVF